MQLADAVEAPQCIWIDLELMKPSVQISDAPAYKRQKVIAVVRIEKPIDRVQMRADFASQIAGNRDGSNFAA